MFKVIREERVLPDEWPGDKAMAQLVQRAGGLFIWAATAYRFVAGGAQFAGWRLDTLLKSPASDVEPEHRLDEIYLNVLRNALADVYSDDERNEACHALGTVLGTIVLLFSSLPAPSLASLIFQLERDVLDTVCDLH
jgi:hypothetical protein